MLKGCKATWSGKGIVVEFASVSAFAEEYNNNIKAGGLFVAIENPPPLHAHIGLAIVVEGERVEMAGNVVWSNPQGAGIQLGTLKPEVVEQFQAILNKDKASTKQAVASPPQKKSQSAKFSNRITPLNVFAGKPVWSSDSLYAPLLKLRDKKFTGFFNVRGEDIADRFRLDLRGGKISFPTKFLDSRDVGPMLKKFKAISNIQLQKAIKWAQDKDLTIREAMIELGIASEEMIVRLVRVKLLRHSARIFALPSGTFSITPLDDVRHAQGLLDVDLRTLIYCGLSQAMEELLDKTVIEKMDALGTKYPKAVDNVVDCDVNELKLWELVLSGKHTVRSLLGSSPFSRQDSYRTLVAWMGAGFVKLGQDVESAQQNANKEVAKMRESMETDDAFVRLGIHWSHPPNKINKAYHERREQLEALAGLKLSATERDQIKEMSKWVEEAYKRIANKEKRCAYRLERVSEEQCKNSARILFQKAQLSIFRHSYRDAYDMLEACVELDPKDESIAEVFEKIKRLKK